MTKLFLSIGLLLISINVHSVWYTSSVVEVSAWGIDDSKPILFIRTQSNPNPAACPSKWAGAAWVNNDQSTNLAASIALAAKATNAPVKFAIDDSLCSANGLPIMHWIQIQ